MESDFHGFSFSSQDLHFERSESSQIHGDLSQNAALTTLFQQTLSLNSHPETASHTMPAAKKGLRQTLRSAASKVARQSVAIFKPRRGNQSKKKAEAKRDPKALAATLREHPTLTLRAQKLHALLDEHLHTDEEELFTNELISPLLKKDPKRALQFVHERVAREVAESDGDEEILLRSDTLFSKSMKAIYREYAAEFRREVFELVLSSIRSRGTCEVDPARLKEERLDEQQTLLLHHVETFFSATGEHLKTLPEEVKEIFHHLFEAVCVEYEDEEVAWKQVGSQLFLRCLIPALLSPDLHIPASDQGPLSPAEVRTLILISKIVQNAANRTGHGHKQPFLSFADQQKEEFERASFTLCTEAVAFTQVVDEEHARQLSGGLEGVTIERMPRQDLIKIHPRQAAKGLGDNMLSNKQYAFVRRAIVQDCGELHQNPSPVAALPLFGKLTVLSPHMTPEQKKDLIALIQGTDWADHKLEKPPDLLVTLSSPTHLFSSSPINPKEAVNLKHLMTLNQMIHRSNTLKTLLDLIIDHFLDQS